MAILLLMNCDHIYGYQNARSYIVELSPETGKPIGPAARIGFDPDLTSKTVQGDDKKWRRKDAGKTLFALHTAHSILVNDVDAAPFQKNWTPFEVSARIQPDNH